MGIVGVRRSLPLALLISVPLRLEPAPQAIDPEPQIFLEGAGDGFEVGGLGQKAKHHRFAAAADFGNGAGGDKKVCGGRDGVDALFAKDGERSRHV